MKSPSFAEACHLHPGDGGKRAGGPRSEELAVGARRRLEVAVRRVAARAEEQHHGAEVLLRMIADELRLFRELGGELRRPRLLRERFEARREGFGVAFLEEAAPLDRDRREVEAVRAAEPVLLEQRS